MTTRTRSPAWNVVTVWTGRETGVYSDEDEDEEDDDEVELEDLDRRN